MLKKIKQPYIWHII